MKPVYIFAILIAGGLVVFAMMQSKPKVGSKNAQTAPGINLSGILSFFNSKPQAPASTPPQNNAASNYLADTTAASDNASGVVGFGGWD